MEFNINELQIINRGLLLLREKYIKDYENDNKHISLLDIEVLEKKYALFRDIMKLENVQEKINNYFNFIIKK